MVHFNIPEFRDIDQFLSLVARKLGRLKKGGRPDLNGAAKYVSCQFPYSILLRF